ncbi:MAG: hypothetical protein NUV82_04205 [Candidatus Komeilibacteria bacterium]|nr:hypothetical protein [Candidatus Komeilibacteria bacterium]
MSDHDIADSQILRSERVQRPSFYISVLLGAILIFGFSFWQFQKHIAAPFEKEPATATEGHEQVQANALAASDEELKQRDSDGDGLSDYMEIRIYGTSAYITDTDSDGTNDKQEIISGADPLCTAEGQCVRGLATTTAEGDESAVTVEQLEEAELRERLSGMGFTEADLAILTRADMQELYENSLVFLQTQSGDGNITLSADDYKSLSIAEIRELLIANGAPADEIDAISDDELRAIFDQVVEERFKE